MADNQMKKWGRRILLNLETVLIIFDNITYGIVPSKPH